MKKPKPIDLENFLILGVKIPEEAWSVIVSGEPFSEERFRGSWKSGKPAQDKWRSMIITQMTEVCKESIRLTAKEIRERIKSACEFWLRYCQHPEKLQEEHLEDYKKWVVYFAEIRPHQADEDRASYMEWLFKLAFRDVMEDEDVTLQKE